MIEPLHSQCDSFLKDLDISLSESKDTADLFEKIVNVAFTDKLLSTQLGLGIVVLLMVNKKDNTIDRVALSKTFQAQGAVNASVKEFREIKIPINEERNLITRVIKNQRSEMTADWKDLFFPDLTPQEARFNQAGAGIACSVVHPLSSKKPGAIIFSYFIEPNDIDSTHESFMQRYCLIVSEALDNQAEL
jgi:hypothetical protein